MTTTPQTVFKFLVGATIAAAILFLIWYFGSIVGYILISAVLAVVGSPLVGTLTRIHIKGWRIPRWVAALVTLLVIWAVAIILCTSLFPLVFSKIHLLSSLDLGAVVGSIREPLAEVQDFFHRVLGVPETAVPLADSLTDSLKSLISFKSINSVFSSVVGLALSAVVALFSVSFITFFFLKDERLFYSMVSALFPEQYHDNITHALDSVTVLLSRYFRGLLTESLLLMIVVSLTMMVFGMKAADAGFIGLIMGVMNVVPYAGPLIGGVMSVFMGVITPIEGMTVGHTAVVIAGSLLILKGLDDFVLQPTLYSERVKAHPLEIFLVILLAGSMAGIVGMLLAIPSYTVLRVFAKEFFSQFRLVRKLTEKI